MTVVPPENVLAPVSVRVVAVLVPTVRARLFPGPPPSTPLNEPVADSVRLASVALLLPMWLSPQAVELDGPATMATEVSC